MNIKPIKRLLFSNSKTNIFIIIGSILLTCVLFIVGFIYGIKESSVSHMIHKYTSHAMVHPVPESALHNSCFWQNTNTVLEESLGQQFIRDITTRTTISAFYNHQNPIQLISIEERDHKVFSMPFDTDIPDNEVYIGKGLAERLDIKENDPFPITIPSIKTPPPLLKVGHIFYDHDPYYNEYAVFLTKKHFDDLLHNEFEYYHIRFTASPFYPILSRNIDNILPRPATTIPDQYLQLPFAMLDEILDINFGIGLFLYSILGIILFLITYQKFIETRNNTYKVLYRNSLSYPKIIVYWFLDAFKCCFIMTILSFILLTVLIFAKISIPSTFIQSVNGLDTAFRFPISEAIKAVYPFMFMLKLFGFGSLLFIIHYGLAMVLTYFITIFQNPVYQFTGVALGSICLIIITIFATQNYFQYTSLEKGRDVLWKVNYFGEYQLSHSSYEASRIFELPFIDFSFNEDLKEFQHIRSIEGFGKISVDNNPHFTKNKVKIIGLEGNYNQEINDLIKKLDTGKIIVGIDIGKFYPTNSIIELNLEKQTGIMTNTTLLVNEVKKFSTPEFNNTIFMNKNRLSRLLEQDTTKIQIFGKWKPNSELNVDYISFKENSKKWRYSSSIVIRFILISSIIKMLWGFMWLLSVCIILTHHKYDEFLMYHRLGIIYFPYKKCYLIGIINFILGVFISGLISLFFLAKTGILPNSFLVNTTNIIHYRLDPLAFFISLGILLSISVIFYTIFTLYTMNISQKIAKKQLRTFQEHSIN